MDLHGIKAKIKKLLRLAHGKGATEAEAALAAEKAQQLLDEHKLSQADLGGEEQREQTAHQTFRGRGFGYRRTPVWRSRLRRACADTTYCIAVKDEHNGSYHLFGKPTDIAVCVELYQFLAEQVERLARSYDPSADEQVDGSRYYSRRSLVESFKAGCAARVARRLREAFEERQKVATATHGERALVLYDDVKAATALSRVVFPYQRESKTRARSVDFAYAAGQAAGDGVRLNVERKLGNQGTALLA